MKKSRIIWLVTMASLALAYGLASSFPSAAGYHTDPGRTCDCVCHGIATLEGYGPVEANGRVSAQWVANSDADDPNIWSEVVVVGFNNTQTNPELGTLTWTLDNTREYASSIQSDQPGNIFPATATLGWYANMELNGVQYRTIQPIEMQATITGWPNNNTVYQQVGAVDLERVDSPGEIAFTLSGMETQVTQQ